MSLHNLRSEVYVKRPNPAAWKRELSDIIWDDLPDEIYLSERQRSVMIYKKDNKVYCGMMDGQLVHAEWEIKNEKDLETSTSRVIRFLGIYE